MADETTKVQGLVLRPARSEDVATCVELCLLANGSELKRFFGDLQRGVTLRDTMRVLCAAPDTEFSWRHFTLGEQDGQVIAGLCAVPTDDYPRLNKSLPYRLQQDAGIGSWGLTRLLFRGVIHKLLTPDAPKPPASLYMPVGAVLPTHRRKGIATQVLLHVIRNARNDRYLNLCLEVNRSNQAARALYVSLGFQPSALRGFGRKCLMTLRLHPPGQP